MLTAAEYKKILALHNQGQSIRSIRKHTGHSRNTIRKVLDIQTPPTFKVFLKPSIIDDYKDLIKAKFDVGTLTSLQIYEEIGENGYKGSYSTVRRHLSKLAKERECTFKEPIRKRKNRKDMCITWLLRMAHGKIRFNEIETRFSEYLDKESAKILYDYILEGSLRYRNRSITVFAHLNNISKRKIADYLGSNRSTVRGYINKFETNGTEGLFDFSRKEPKKYEEQRYKENVFKILHSPPSCYGFNRTTWRMEDLYQIMTQEDVALSKTGIRKIIKNEGYRFIKAKKVLTSTDPQYREKLEGITNILSNLKNNEKFFSIDEFGPFAIKMQGGRSWVPQGDNRIVPQWQKSKGSLIVTAALELSTNQVVHFYSAKKNTDEMIKLLERLLDKYQDEDRIFLSWDAASWHISKKLYEYVEEVNGDSFRSVHKTPFIALAPLPASAQFLNVIESIFSGMARAIIHNSDYVSVEECMAAIDRYFKERNQYYLDNPKRAGNKIWGKELTKVEFNESNNCKDPRFCR